MSSIICFRLPSDNRKELVFRPKRIPLKTLYDTTLLFPCIGLYHATTGIPVGHPGFERWLFELQKVEDRKSQTLWKKAENLCSFLNFMLWNTNCDRFQDLSLNHLRDFMIDYRKIPGGADRDPQEWARGISDIFQFLKTYIENNESLSDFKLEPKDLYTPVSVSIKNGKRKIIVNKMSKLYVKPPKKRHKKYRYLLHGHLELFLFEAKKYDPMILPAIMLQAYAGLREGEVVNITMSSIKRITGRYSRIKKIVIELMDEAEFSKEHAGKTEFGSNKVYRRQEVYWDFIDEVIGVLDEHEKYMISRGYSADDDAPLFRNHWGKPLTVSAYSSRVKKLFYEHFLPDLKRLCEHQGTWAENAPYIEAYEREYPGAHMFRHWFTMYLLEYTNLTIEEIAMWRGDKDSEAMKAYIHINERFIRAFKESIFTAQRALFKEIL